MSNIKTKDRDNADLDIAAKDIGGVAFPRNIITDPSGADITPLTDAQLRADPVPVALDAASLAAIENTTVELGATSLAALENVTVGGTVELGSTSLAALESITVGGTVELGSTSLEALESITATGPLTDDQLRATPVAMSADALPLPVGAATEATLSGLLTDAQLRAAPLDVEYVAPPFVRVGFAEVGSGIVGNAANELQLLQTGSGMAVNQSGGNLVVTTGTTANAETVIRSVRTFTGSLLARLKTILSQRIANQTFRFELADLLGDGLAYTINSATSVTVSFPATNPFTAANVGQSLRLSRISGAAGIPGRYAIASVSGLTVTFTVAAWPASGSGTLSLYGWNYIQIEYSGTTATNASFDAQRRGWNSGNTTATINTTASPGHVAQIGFDVFTAGLADALVASNTGYQWTNRASRIENIPDPDVPLYLFIIVQNGSSAPASTTTLTVGFVQIEDQGRQKVRIASSDPVGSHALPVQVLGGSVALSANTPTLAAGTNLAGDVGTQYRANATGAASIVNIASPATPAGATIKGSAGRLLALSLVNTSAGVRWVKIFNATTVTMGTTSAVIDRPIPAGGTMEFQMEGGLGFATGIMIAVTSARGQTDNTTTGLALGDVCGFAAYA